MIATTGAALPAATGHTVRKSAHLREAANKLEASFLAEMLKSAGLGRNNSSFNGGVGEEQFSSFLVQAQADELVQSGGIGLSEMFFHALMERTNGG